MAKPKRKWIRIAAMVVAAVVLIGSVALVLVEKFAPDQTYIPQSLVSIPSTVISTILKPFQGVFSWVSNGVVDYLETWKLRKSIEIEYNRLVQENNELIYRSMYVESLEAENERLKKELKVFNEYESRKQNPVHANVTAKETGNWFQVFTIDKGEDDGVEPYMAVVNGDGLIGYTMTVGKTTSQVITIIDSRAGVSGLIESSREQGIISGTLGIDDEPTCRMRYLPDDLVPRPGDTVVTSGIGYPFPKGIPIGEVRESTRYVDDNKRYFVIEPYVDFQHIEEVIVLVYTPEVEEISDTSDNQGRYVAGPLDTARPIPTIGSDIEDPNINAVTPPPRATRVPSSGTIDPEGELGTVAPTGSAMTLDPNASPSPSPSPDLDSLLWEETGEQGGVG